MKQIGSRKVLRLILAATVIVLMAMQLVPVDRSNPPVETEVGAPAEVRALLRRACYDCHSNETVWPWYSRIAPISWMVANDVRQGREKLNFSTWNRITAQKQARKLNECWKEVAEGEMPPWFYLAVHREAVLSVEDRAMVRNWALGANLVPAGRSVK